MNKVILWIKKIKKLPTNCNNNSINVIFILKYSYLYLLVTTKMKNNGNNYNKIVKLSWGFILFLKK
jgi:hypothetical protein